MERKAMEGLIEWKNNKNRKLLLLYGARQVGKKEEVIAKLKFKEEEMLQNKT